jgi:hypothetical protein
MGCYGDSYIYILCNVGEKSCCDSHEKNWLELSRCLSSDSVTFNHLLQNILIRTSQETNYFSASKTNRLMLFKERVDVCCEQT